MKFLCAVAAICCLVQPSAALVKTEEDQHHVLNDFVGNSMWIFGNSGAYVFSPDGKERKNFIAPDDICHKDPNAPTSGYRSRCRFNDIVSDGKKYVWAAVSSGHSKILIFDIDTGAVVGNFQTCYNPNSLEYHPLRDEVWVRCSDINENSTEPTNLDVFSASSPSVNIQTDILLQDRALKEHLSSRGHSIIHNTLGDVGFITDTSLPYLFKFDLSEKTIMDQFEMKPTPHGLDAATYSPVNKHVFAQAQFCCTCGFEGADRESCGRRGGSNVTVTSGPFAGQSDVLGVCGSSCEIEGIDIAGVYEFDTANETIVATHLMQEGTGGEPYPSPDGKYIVIIGRNGGRTVRILEAGEPGSPSRVFADLEFDFNRTGYDGQQVFKDFAFVERDGTTKLVFASGTEHKLAIVDMADGELETSYITFNEDPFVKGRAPHGRYRQVEWAVGTDYVWVNDYDVEEIYVIDVINQELVTTIPQLDSYRLLSVQNYERVFQFNLQKELIATAAADMMANQPIVANQPVVANRPQVQAAATTNEAQNAAEENGGGGPNTLGIVALVLGLAAVAVGLANLQMLSNMKKEMEQQRINSLNNVKAVGESVPVDVESELSSIK